MTGLDLLGRDLRIEWHEAVAIVRAVAEQLPTGPETIAVPELNDIELLPRGEIQVHAASEVSEPIGYLGQLLQAFLRRADPPVQLRLLISQPQQSLEGFADALGFFERPDRDLVLQALYNRASAALPLPGVEELPLLTTSAEPAAEPPVSDAPGARRRKLFYMAAVLAISVGAIALYAASGASASGQGSDLRSKVSSGVSNVTSTVGSAVSAIGERVGLGSQPATPAPVETPNPVAAGDVSVKSKRASKSPVQSPVPELERATIAAFDLEPSAESATVPKETIVIIAEPASARPGESVDSVIYSSSSADVDPPVGLRPQLPKEMPAGVRVEDLTRIELVILPDGMVESVKLLDKPHDIHASMLLSAAKAWQFRPAMRDGVPVKYRKTVWVAR